MTTTNLRVLIVDDEPLARQGLKLRLQAHDDVEIVGECNNGLDAVALIPMERPDLVFLDIQMPELNGFQATRKLSQDPETKEIPVIMVTTKDQETDRVWGQRQGAKAFLVKPVEEADLMAEINKFL